MRKGKIKKIVTITIFQAILLVFALWVIFPLLWGVSTSLKTLEGAFQNYSLLPPQPVQWNNYIEAWKTGNFGRYFLNSIVYIIVVVTCMLIFASLAAYAFARLTFPFKEFFFYLFLASLVMPVTTTFITVYLLLMNFPLLLIIAIVLIVSLIIFNLGSYRRLAGVVLISIIGYIGWYLTRSYYPQLYEKLPNFLALKINFLNTRIGYILPQIAGGLAFSIFLMRSFIEALPVDLEDAARIDGCSRLGIYLRIILPLSKPIIAVTGIFAALSVWKEFLFAVIIFVDDSKMPIQRGLLEFQGTYKFNWNYLMAAVIITVIPVILIYLILQKQVISGLTAGAVKG